MEKVSRFIENNPGSSRNDMRTGVAGKTDYKDLAVATLVADPFVERHQHGQKWEHGSVRPYREADDETPNRSPGPQPVPNRSPGPVESDRSPGPRPIQDRGPGRPVVEDG